MSPTDSSLDAGIEWVVGGDGVEKHKGRVFKIIRKSRKEIYGNL